jgi:hypothetical protein
LDIVSRIGDKGLVLWFSMRVKGVAAAGQNWKERPCDGSCLIIIVDLVEWILCCCTSYAGISCCSLENPFWLSGRRILTGVSYLQSLLLAVEELSCAVEAEALTFFEVLLLDKLGL